MMAAGSEDSLNQFAPVMETVSKTIHRVGSEAGMGQTVKACLQSLIGSAFSATFEAAALAAKAGVDGEVLHKVFSTSGQVVVLSIQLWKTSLIANLKELQSHQYHVQGPDNCNGHGQRVGVPLHTAGCAMQLFQAGRRNTPTEIIGLLPR